MGSFKIVPDIETDQQYRVENPTDMIAKTTMMSYTLMIISTMSIIETGVSYYIITKQYRQIEELVDLTVKCGSIIKNFCQENIKQTDDKNAVSESVRQNIQLIESDLMVSESNLIDELQNNAYLSEEEAKTMKLRNRSDQAHLFAEILEVMNNRNFLRILDMLRRCSFEHIACSLQSSYEDLTGTQVLAITSNPMCPICRLRYEVDIKVLRSGLKKEELLPYRLYIEINGCQARRGHQDYLWQELLSHLKSLDNESVENKFIKIFDTPRHQGLYECFLQKFPTNFECSCES